MRTFIRVVLSIFAFLALGYVRPFPRFEDTPLLIVGIVWGLLVITFLGIYTNLAASTIYGLPGITTAIVATLSFFARFDAACAVADRLLQYAVQGDGAANT
jgi:hypothetical protein